MTEYDNSNRWVLFKNDRKQTDKHPDYTGTINVNSVEYELSAWLKEGRKGKFFSGTVKPKREIVKDMRERADPAPSAIDDEIPF